MDLVGASLSLASVVLFSVALGLSTRPSKAAKQTPAVSGHVHDQKSIVINLPQGNLLPGDYTLDLKISLSGGKQEANEGKKERNGQREKKLYRRLDEYM